MKSIADARTIQFLADLDRLDTKQSKVQREIASGYRVNLPSDAPEQMIDILQLRSDVERAQGIDRNLGRVASEVDTAEAAVRVATQLLERARTVAAQTGTDTATNRQGIAIEVRQIHQQLVDITRTMSEGRFVFSGDADSSPLYDADWTQPGGINRLLQTSNTRQVLDVNGTSFSVTRTAAQILDVRKPNDTPDTANVFNAVYQLGKALEADDVVAVRSASALINSSLDHLGRELTFYGNSQNRVANAQTLAKKALNTRKTELAGRQETDMAAAIVELSTVKVHREAALGAQGQQPRTSLFDYLA